MTLETLLKYLPQSILSILSVIILIVVLCNYKKILNKISVLKLKDIEVNFTNFKDVSTKGEGIQAEKLRSLLLKQLLFTQEFVNRFQPLLLQFVTICKKWDENILSDSNDKEQKYPSLKYSSEALKRFRDLLRNTKFDYVINWNCPIYDKVNSGYRDSFIKNLGHLNNDFANNNAKLYIPNLVEDCTKKTPTIDIKETNILNGYNETKMLLYEYLSNIENAIQENDSLEVLEETNSNKISKNIIFIEKLKECISDFETYIGEQNDRETTLVNRYNYAMDICNCMYESLLFWNEKTSRILQSETSTILYLIYQNLSLWLIRNDLPLSQVKLEQYLDTHAQNLVAKINEEVIKQVPRFNRKMWQQALESINETDTNINNYFRNNLKDWIIGVQQVRFGVNIFIGNEDFKQ